jgi:predicted alpha/beta superfamily hydrolase
MKHFPSNSQEALLDMSPASHEPNKMPFLGLQNLESHEENSSVSGTHKKISSLPLSEIEKVNELMATHHRPQASEHHEPYLSYKLKIVIAMFIIGIAFLLFDTFSDRKSYNNPK